MRTRGRLCWNILGDSAGLLFIFQPWIPGSRDIFIRANLQPTPWKCPICTLWRTQGEATNNQLALYHASQQQNFYDANVDAFHWSRHHRTSNKPRPESEILGRTIKAGDNPKTASFASVPHCWFTCSELSPSLSTRLCHPCRPSKPTPRSSGRNLHRD